MSLNLLDAVKGLITPELIGNAASFLGEEQGGVTKAIGAAAPALLQGIINKAGTDNGASILDMATKAAGSGILDNLGGLFGSGGSSMMNLGSTLVSGLFGDKGSMLGNLISSFAGVKPSTGSSLLSALAPMALSLVGKYVMSNGLSGGGLLSWLTGQKDSVAKAMPAGLNLSSIFNEGPAKVVQESSSYREPAREEASSGMPKWLLPLLLIALGALALWYFMRGCNPKEQVPAVVEQVEAAVDTATAKVTEVVRETLNVTLPDGTVLSAFRGGIEDKLVACLNDANCKIGKDVWFDFDNLNFEMGSAKLTAESQAQVNNIAAILKAYPKVKIKIGGYTDKTGDDAANKKLSQERADAVTAAIKTAGANAAQLLAGEGYGSEFATVPADASDEARRVDRRISVSVREK
ncbi:MAG: OmpA family protein [Chitinophagaceae bacterium]|jgi:outer membrane protein OmpA-like peptidoglycan-associated protein|nr:OmpA family protein [Chitinophagaceae bacterium]